jgi:hypothetical protein
MTFRLPLDEENRTHICARNTAKERKHAKAAVMWRYEHDELNGPEALEILEMLGLSE